MVVFVPKPTSNTGIVCTSNYTQTLTESQKFHQQIYRTVCIRFAHITVYTHENINRVRLVTSYILPFLSLMNMGGLSDIFDDVVALFSFQGSHLLCFRYLHIL